ncbi:hypothetical protein GCM10023321_19360 [Pseudonocardia eucalypti]|uniref:Uncharacterized protein n=1 Tax=Pseudonocardia eucalypti TaxID=648755 RepID=A0ABP9PT35_9PSEU|nr:hypothetical protein [Pseudonocardia eucalypti]
MGDMIQEQTLEALSWEKEEYADPSEGVLRLTLDGEMARLDWRERGAGDRACAFQVSARSLLLALGAAWEETRPAGGRSGKPGAKKSSQEDDESLFRDITGRYARKGKPWTAEEDERLRAVWREGGRDIVSMGEVMRRSGPAVAARLRLLGYDPSEVPDPLGRDWDGVESVNDDGGGAVTGSR